MLKKALMAAAAGAAGKWLLSRVRGGGQRYGGGRRYGGRRRGGLLGRLFG